MAQWTCWGRLGSHHLQTAPPVTGIAVTATSPLFCCAADSEFLSILVYRTHLLHLLFQTNLIWGPPEEVNELRMGTVPFF